MKVLFLAVTLASLLSVTLAWQTTDSEAPAGYSGQTNGMVDQATHSADQASFDEVENVPDGLGPLYNAQSCRECHQSPVSGGVSQTTEVRVGHRGPDGRFENPSIPIADGKVVITGRTLVNDRAICPNASFADVQLQERVPDTENIRTTRLSVNLLGDGFVEAVPDQTLEQIAEKQCRSTHRRICGQVLYVPILEAPGKTGVGRFGWKDAHASVLSFSADAYLNEMGITNRLLPTEITILCNTVSEPNNTAGSDGLDDIDHFARFIRASQAPPRDQALAETPEAVEGSKLFDRTGCATCHARELETAPAGTKINGGAFTIPDALGGKVFHPFGDYLLHNVGTGDGIAIAMEEHYGKKAREMAWEKFSYPTLLGAANKVRTAPLWGLRTHSRLMHDGKSVTITDAILRHGGEAEEITERFRRLKPSEKKALLTFLRSL